MNEVITFIDSSVLLAAWRGVPNIKIKALTILSEVNRKFISSPFIKLELLPKAVYHKNSVEVKFYETFFDAVENWNFNSDEVIILAEKIAEKYGLNGMDALHIAASIKSNSGEFITAERQTSPLMRIKELKVISIR